MQIGPVIFLLLNEGFFNAGNDGKCMQKIKDGENTCETYLGLADGLITDEECYLLDQMNLSGEYIDVVEFRSITLAPSSTCPIRENSKD